MSPTAPPRTLSIHAARRAADRLRAEWLLALADGTADLPDLLTACADPDNKPLLRLRLRQVLMAQPRWGPAKTRAALNRFAAAVGIPTDRARRTTLAWLLDPRAGGRRMLTLIDTLPHQDYALDQWPRFPYGPPPDTADTRMEDLP